MIPFAEPRADIAAQIRAMADPSHPKRAVFIPADRLLITADGERRIEPRDDRMMARILGLPEAKCDAVARSGGWRFLWRARIVQARDPDGHVITEALTSPAMLATTRRMLAQHGTLVEMNPVAAIVRRVARRIRERASL